MRHNKHTGWKVVEFKKHGYEVKHIGIMLHNTGLHIIADCGNARSQSNRHRATRIVHAVNAHDKLVKTVRELLELCEISDRDLPVHEYESIKTSAIASAKDILKEV